MIDVISLLGSVTISSFLRCHESGYWLAVLSLQQKRDLSWCTEWEVQESVPEVAEALSPRERKLTPNVFKEGHHPWVQVPTYKQTLDPNFDSTNVLRRSNSFDGSHFIIQVGGLETKLPFMSSLEVYWDHSVVARYIHTYVVIFWATQSHVLRWWWPSMYQYSL